MMDRMLTNYSAAGTFEKAVPAIEHGLSRGKAAVKLLTNRQPGRVSRALKKVPNWMKTAGIVIGSDVGIGGTTGYLSGKLGSKKSQESADTHKKNYNFITEAGGAVKKLGTAVSGETGGFVKRLEHLKPFKSEIRNAVVNNPKGAMLTAAGGGLLVGHHLGRRSQRRDDMQPQYQLQLPRNAREFYSHPMVKQLLANERVHYGGGILRAAGAAGRFAVHHPKTALGVAAAGYVAKRKVVDPKLDNLARRRVMSMQNRANRFI